MATCSKVGSVSLPSVERRLKSAVVEEVAVQQEKYMVKERRMACWSRVRFTRGEYCRKYRQHVGYLTSTLRYDTALGLGPMLKRAAKSLEPTPASGNRVNAVKKTCWTRPCVFRAAAKKRVPWLAARPLTYQIAYAMRPSRRSNARSRLLF